MRLPDLVRAAYPDLADVANELPDVEIAGVSQDSRRVGPGWLFVARQGAAHDGIAFIPAARAAGAVAVAGGAGVRPRNDLLHGLPYVPVPDDRAAVARLAAAFYDRPSRKLRVVGVTGTDGKTTTATLAWWLLSDLAPTSLASTAATRIGDRPHRWPGHFTTPEADDVQAFLADAVASGSRRAVLESSSHGLALHRLDEIDYALALWTNLTPEHLDFHGTLEAYRDAKRTLVRRAEHAILNRDDPHYDAFAEAAQGVTSFGTDRAADWRLLDVRPQAGGLALRVGTPDGREIDADLPMPGRYNASNAVAAWAAAAHEGGDALAIRERLAAAPGVPGRMQTIQRRPFAVVIDFAHTPSALAQVLEATEPDGGRTLVVIGAAGERDPSKRAPIGAAAVTGADFAIFTEEDARSEDPVAIVAAIAAGARHAGAVEGRDFVTIVDRRAAIDEAIERARPGDLVLLCGKGHEATLERAGETVAWNEADEARSALRRRGFAGSDDATLE